ncbi:MAG: hypothetical protein K8R36_22890 [Planctomycetales bacterium]|nr:hypothetical protein [Planctomycetales bacterium]
MSEVARRVQGTAVNLIVDNDIIGNAGVRVPTAHGESLTVVPFDAPTDEIPFEDRLICDHEIFASFPYRLSDTRFALGDPKELLISRIWGLVDAPRHSPPTKLPEIDQFWNWARQTPAGHVDNLGRTLAEVRHRYEGLAGLKTLELPLSLVSRLEGFRNFALHLCGRSAEFLLAYNAAVHEYRAVNKIKSNAHPVPDLEQDGEWSEAPFWIWTAEDPRRRRLFVRRTNQSLELTDRNKTVVKFKWASHTDAEILASCDWYNREPTTNWRIRPRALITTMYARLVLSDLFIHGIGGAKYDEVTDAIIRRFFGIEPPGYVTATATIRLPLERPQVTSDDLIALDRKYRDTIHHPEVFLDDYSGHHRAEFANLVKQKQELIAHRWQEKQKKSWHDQVTQANERMSSLLELHRERLRKDREQLVADLHRARILGSREYSICLFPEDMLVPLLKKLAGIQS